MSLNVSVKKRQDDVYVVKPEGRLDSDTYLMFEERVTPLFVASTKGLIFDMSNLDYISSAGVRVVFKTRKALGQLKGSFMMINLKPQIRKVFEIINALPDIRVFRNMEEADRYLDTMQKKELEKQKESSEG